MFETIKIRARTLSALALGSAPAFLTPVVIVQRLDVTDSSSVLLVYSISAIVAALFSNTIETTTLAILSSIYATGGSVSRRQVRFLALEGLRLSAVPVVTLFCGLLVAYWRLSSGLSLMKLCTAGLLIIPIPLILAWCAAYSGELFARRKLSIVYLSGLGRGVPPLLAAFIVPELIAVSAAYLLGESLRAIFLWRNCARGIGTESSSDTIPFGVRQMSALFISNSLGQIMPALMQAIFAWSGPTAIGQGAIALRVQAAIAQVTTGGLIMHNVSRFAAMVFNTEGGKDAVKRVLLREAIKVCLAAVIVASLGLVTVGFAFYFLRELLSPTVLGGLVWSSVLIAALPTVALTFWAGRGLIIAGIRRPLPTVIAVASLISAALGLLLLPLIDGVSALIASGVCSVITAIGYTFILLRNGPAQFASQGSSIRGG